MSSSDITTSKGHLHTVWYYATWSPNPWSDMHDTSRITSPKPSSYHLSQDAACPAWVYEHLLEKTHSTWSTDRSPCPMTGLTLLPPQHTLLTHDTVTTFKPTQEAYIHRFLNVERSCDKSWGWWESRESRQLERGLDIYWGWLVRRYMLTRTAYLRPLSEDSFTLAHLSNPGWPTGCLVSTQMICIQLHPTHMLYITIVNWPSLVVAMGPLVHSWDPRTLHAETGTYSGMPPWAHL